ncbi:12118_t:CDS:1, partial [Gigaspora rosea]
GAPIFVIKQIGEDAVTFGGQLKYKFQDPDPDKYVFILRNGDSIYAIYNF